MDPGFVVDRIWRKIQIPWAFVCVILIWVYIFPYSTSLNNPNERTRVLQARALVQYGQLHIAEATRDRGGNLQIRDIYGHWHGGAPVNDVGIACIHSHEKPPSCVGKIYPAKGPGVAIIGVPALWLARRMGWVPDGLRYESRATWVLRYGGVALLMFMALVILSLFLREACVAKPIRTRIVLATALGTSVFPYSISFVGHAVAGGVILIGLYFLHRSCAAHRWSGFVLAVLGGHWVAWSALMEYHAVVGIAIVSAWVLLSQHRWRLLPGYALGSLGALALFMYLHKLMFFHPLRTGHFALMSEHNRFHQSKGFLGIGGFYPEAIAANLFDPYMGIFFLMPWLLVGLLLGWSFLFLRKQGNLSIGLTRTIAFIPLGYLLFIATLESWRVMNGWSYGPRYLTPTMLCMAMVAGLGWNFLYQRHRRWYYVFVGFVLASVIITASVTMIFPSPPDRLRNPWSEMVLPLLSSGWSSRNVLMFLGPYSLVLFGLLILGICVWIAYENLFLQHGRSQRWSFRISRWGGILLTAIWLFGMGKVKLQDTYWQKRVLEYCQRVMEGIAPQEENPFFDDQKK